MPSSVVVLESQPGIQKDGTLYDRKSYVDGQWVRFYRGRPRMIGGYRMIDQGNTTLVRTLFNYDNPDKPNKVDTYIGRSNSVSYETFDLNGVGISEVDRTPSGLVVNIDNVWDFDIFIDTETTDGVATPYIVALVAPNASDSSNTTEGILYYGHTTGPNANDPLIPVVEAGTGNPIKASGGVVVAPPYIIVYGNDGVMRWSEAGKVSNWPSGVDVNTQSIASNKIIKMVLSRGSAAPLLLAWTLDTIYSVSYNPIVSEFVSFTPVLIDNSITVMSPNSIVGYANEYYWVGLKKLYFFNGLVRPLENTMNAEFFFNSVNLGARSKIFGKVINSNSGTAEMWWFFPLGGPQVTENNHAIILNLDIPGKRVWYDTPINRSAGYSSGIFPYPMLADNVPLDVPTRTGIVQVYPIWMHEYTNPANGGYDQIFDLPAVEVPIKVSSIDAFFQTHIYDFFESNPANNRAMRTRRLEPDFLMNPNLTNNMTLKVYNQYFPSDSIANGKVKITGPYTFNLNTDKIDVSLQGRLASFRFEINQVGGIFEMGKTLLDYNIGDGRTNAPGTSGVGG